MTAERVISRRSLIRFGGLAALGAGATVATHAPQPVEAAAERVVVVNADDLVQECRERWAEYAEAKAEARAMSERFEASLTPEQRAAFMRVDDARTESYSLEEYWQAAELARHLPAFAPVVRLVWEHVRTSAYGDPAGCCAVAKGFES